MTFSIVMPCHNAASWIQGALTSIARQTMTDYEIIVVDDGSTDGSAEKVRATGIPVRLFVTNFKNAAAARNLGINAASGNWVAFLDADDEWYPTHLENAAAALDGGQAVAFMAAARYFNHSGEEVPGPRLSISQRTEKSLSHGDFIEWFSRTRSFCNCTVVASRQRLAQVGSFDESLVRRHDFELFMRLIHGHRWAYSPIPGARIHRDSPGSISRNVVTCSRFALLAMSKRKQDYDSVTYRRMIRRQAATAMSLAFRYGNTQEQADVYALAIPYLDIVRKAIYGLARYSPRSTKTAFKLMDHLRYFADQQGYLR